MQWVVFISIALLGIVATPFIRTFIKAIKLGNMRRDSIRSFIRNCSNLYSVKPNETTINELNSALFLINDGACGNIPTKDASDMLEKKIYAARDIIKPPELFEEYILELQEYSSMPEWKKASKKMDMKWAEERISKVHRKIWYDIEHFFDDYV